MGSMKKGSTDTLGFVLPSGIYTGLCNELVSLLMAAIIRKTKLRMMNKAWYLQLYIRLEEDGVEVTGPYFVK